MLYLCMSFPQLSLEARQPPADEPVAVTDRRGTRRRLIGCNLACIAAGVRLGMDATTALALLPSLRLIERSRPREGDALKSLAAWAAQFSSWTCYDAERHMVWIEVYSGLRYFGGIEVIRSRVEHGLIGRDTAVQELHLELVHDGAEPTRLRVRSSRPLRDGLRLFALCGSDLERTTLPQPVEAITVTVDVFVPLGDTQLELIEGGQRKDRDWEDLLDTLRARMGDIAVRKLGLQDQHLPEKAWCTVEGKERLPDGSLPDRPLWLLEPRQVTSIHFGCQVVELS